MAGLRRTRSGRRRDHAGLANHLSAAGAAPARSALTLRLALAIFGLVLFAAAAVLFALLDLPLALVTVAAALAVIAALNTIVVARRKARGEPDTPH